MSSNKNKYRNLNYFISLESSWLHSDELNSYIKAVSTSEVEFQLTFQIYFYYF